MIQKGQISEIYVVYECSISNDSYGRDEQFGTIFINIWMVDTNMFDLEVILWSFGDPKRSNFRGIKIYAGNISLISLNSFVSTDAVGYVWVLVAALDGALIHTRVPHVNVS